MEVDTVRPVARVFFVSFMGLSGPRVWALAKYRFPGGSRHSVEWRDERLGDARNRMSAADVENNNHFQ